MTDERQVSIYALCDPDTEDIRYIGQSVDVQIRLRAHISNSFNGESKRDKWIRSLFLSGKHPVLKILMTVPLSEADETEVSTIKQAIKNGCKLTNGHASPVGGAATRRRPETFEITFRISRRTYEIIEKVAHNFGGKNMLLEMLVDRYAR